MEPIISISEVVEKRETPGGMLGVCATIESSYDKSKHQLIAQLGSYIQPEHSADHLHPGWLPAPETLREQVDKDEASDLARDMFHRWVRRVRTSVPQTNLLPKD